MKRLVFCIVCFAIPSPVQAANPAQVVTGLRLFTQEFTSTAPGQNGDGLGPVFNEASCVACHNVGGVGGSGEVISNARAIGLSKAEFTPIRPKSSIEEAIQDYSPGFLALDGSVLSSFTLHRRGGSFNFAQLRNRPGSTPGAASLPGNAVEGDGDAARCWRSRPVESLDDAVRE